MTKQELERALLSAPDEAERPEEDDVWYQLTMGQLSPEEEEAVRREDPLRYERYRPMGPETFARVSGTLAAQRARLARPQLAPIIPIMGKGGGSFPQDLQGPQGSMQRRQVLLGLAAALLLGVGLSQLRPAPVPGSGRLQIQGSRPMLGGAQRQGRPCLALDGTMTMRLDLPQAVPPGTEARAFVVRDGRAVRLRKEPARIGEASFVLRAEITKAISGIEPGPAEMLLLVGRPGDLPESPGGQEASSSRVQVFRHQIEFGPDCH